jgi:hypothetical protein
MTHFQTGKTAGKAALDSHHKGGNRPRLLPFTRPCTSEIVNPEH